MKSSRRRVTALGLVLVVAALGVIVLTELSSALQYYVTPTELQSQPASRDVRLYGIVVPGSVRWDAARQDLSFQITDGTTTVAVQTSAIPTNLFRDGIGVVLLGRRDAAGTFTAEELLIKHSSVYEPLRPGETIPPGLLDAIRSGQSPP